MNVLGAISMEVTVVDEQSSLQLDEHLLQRIIPEIIHFEGQKADEVALYFIDNERMCDLHDQFFDDPSPTDCISFPIDDEEEDYRVLGEVFVCPETAQRYVQEHGGDVYREVLLYVIHGLLHLMGYDDIAEEDRKQMRAAEARHLAHLDQLGLNLHAAYESRTQETD